jgi:hypothetical protein
MSISKEAKICCPKCQKESIFKIWQSINVQLDPELKEQILNSEVFVFTCPECNERTFVNYSFLYHDMDKKLMIYLLPDNRKTIEDTAAFVRETVDSELAGLAEGYSVRIVTSVRELQEKINIFDAGYDDRVIELMKVFYLGKMAEKTPNQKVDEILFNIDKDGRKRIIFVADESIFAAAPVDDNFYADVKNTFKDKIEKNPNEYFIYDFVWAKGLVM